MALIPGLPDDLARDCLIRISYDQFAAVSSVCKLWKSQITLPEFRRLRMLYGHCQKVIVMVQALVDPNPTVSVFKCSAVPVYRLTLCDPGTGNWCELPPVPELSTGLPMFCQVVGVGSDLVVLGGWDPMTWKASQSVYVYSFVSSEWRRGNDMPDGPRTFFGCASDFDRTVYVAGGHDDEKNALRSAMAYDVARDTWVQLPDMDRERDECKAVFCRGQFHVIGGYSTEMQGRFERSAEAFDVATWRWKATEEEFLEEATCPRNCVAGDEAMYMCRSGDIVRHRDPTWQTVSKLPAEVRNAAYVTTWQGSLIVIGSAGFGEPHMVYILDLEKKNWRKLESPFEFSGHVQSGCYMEI
ncbi:F-box/kelch-repeat protein At1g15670 [Ziziphus jujuba]|uniref:F-box/kelch-repeat protein At1g15670 n=1 Tax=Ziziphus jujuba TaxID=326968 RepID=A0A6P3Z308_ZIZJJ|nr:F-box/kelch-repeat protein At1g15670 [Ziziphus jujuba]